MSAIEFARTKMSAFYKKISPRIQNPIGRHYFTEIFDVFLQHPATHGKMLVDLVERLPHFFSPQIVAETKEHVRVVTDYLKNMKSAPPHSPFGFAENHALHTLSQYVRENPSMLDSVLNMICTGHTHQSQPVQPGGTLVATSRGWVPLVQVRNGDAVIGFAPMQPDETVKTTNCDWAPVSQTHPVNMTVQSVPIGPKFEFTPTVDLHSPTDWSKVKIPPMYTGDHIVRDGSDEIHVPDTEDQINRELPGGNVVLNFLNDCLVRVNADEFVRKTTGVTADFWLMITGLCQNGLTAVWAKRIAEELTYIHNTFGTSVVGKDPTEFEAVIKILKKNFEPVAPEPATNEQVEGAEKVLAFLDKWLSFVTATDPDSVTVTSIGYTISLFKHPDLNKRDVEGILKALKSCDHVGGKFYFPDLDEEYKEVLVILSKHIA